MKRLATSAAVLSLVCLSLLHSAEFRNGYVIAVPVSPSPVELQSAEELADHLQNVIGARLDIVHEDTLPDKARALYVGQTAFAAAQGIDLENLEQEEWAIRELENGSVILAGGRLRGIQYAVYDYLEKRCGLLWLDEDTTLIPTQPGLGPDAEHPLVVQRKPTFVQRQIYDSLDWHPVSGKFKERNKAFSNTQTATGMARLLGGKRPHHTFIDYSRAWPSDKPELFSRDASGKPLIATSGVGPGQICMTHPEARRLTLERLRAFIAEDRRAAAAAGCPPPQIYDISQNDNYDKCTCDDCRVLAEKEGSYAAPLMDFINWLAREIRKDYPDILLRTFAYTYSAVPPKTLQAEDNVIIHLAMLGCEMGGEYYTYDTMRALAHPFNQANQQRIADWSLHASHLAWWSYWTLYPCGPDATIHVGALQSDLSYAAEKGVYQIFMEYENPVWSYFFPLTRFLGYKLMDDASADIATLTRRFMDGYYGKSAATMTELLDFYQQAQDNYPHRLGEIDVSMRSYLSDDYFQTALRLLAKAEAECGEDARALAHVRRERAPLLGALLLRWPQLLHRERYEHAALVDEFRQHSQATIDFLFPQEDPQGIRKSLQSSLADLLPQIEASSFPTTVPPELQSEGARYLVFNARHFGNTAQSSRQDDPEAFTGMAVTMKTDDSAPVLQVLNWMVNKKLAVVQLDEKKVPRDGAYHWLAIKSMVFEDNARVHTFVPTPSGLCLGFYRRVPAGSVCDLYLSVKVADGKFWMDRAILKY